MSNYQIVKRLATGIEWIKMRQAVGWNTYNEAVSEQGMKDSLYGVVAINEDNEIVGMGRVIGDGITVFFIADVLVKPEYQHVGIGTGIMNALMIYIESTQTNMTRDSQAAAKTFICLNAAKGKEDFYKRFGFINRPNDYYGHGMQYTG